MKTCTAVLVGILLAVRLPAGADVIFQTGFEPDEGWTTGLLDPATAPTGTWHFAGGAYVAPTIETAAPYTFADEGLVPSTGDGLLYADRVTEDDQSHSAWVEVSDDTLHLWTIEADMLITRDVHNSSASLGVLNRDYSASQVVLARVGMQNQTTGARLAYWTETAPGTYGNVYTTDSGVPIIPYVDGDPQWVSFRLELNALTATYSVYYSYGGGEFTNLVEDVAFGNEYAGDYPRSVQFALGGPYRAGIDNLKVSAIPEPSTAGLLLVPALLLAFRKRPVGAK